MANILKMMDHCLRLLAQLMRLAASMAGDKAGSRSAAKMAIMAITKSSSSSVKPCRFISFTSTLNQKYESVC